jgi:hypothetical protein
MDTSMMFLIILDKITITLLKWSRCIAKTKRHSPVGERAVGIGESSLTLVIRMNRNLMIIRVSVEVAEEWVLCQPFKHLINEGEREVIFPGSLIEHPVIDAHPPPSYCPLRYELISLIMDHCHASLLWNILNWSDPLIILHVVCLWSLYNIDHQHIDE